MLSNRVNKKKFWTILLLGVLMLGGINAGLITYYNQYTANFQVIQPISVSGFGDNYIFQNAFSGGTFTEGTLNKFIQNDGDFEIDLSLTTSYEENGLSYSGEGIEVTYEYYLCEIGAACLADFQELTGEVLTLPSQYIATLRTSYELSLALESGDYSVKTTIEALF